MKNIINEKPTDQLFGRTLFTTEFVDKVDIWEKDVLNIGCGYGWFELNAVQKGVKKIIGIEPSEEDLSTAQKYIRFPNVFLSIASALDLPFADKTFDTVFCWEVIEHLPKGSEDRFFFEISRVVKDHGLFYLSTPQDTFLSILFDPAWWLFGHRHYSSFYLTRMATLYHLKTERVVRRGRIWEIVAMLNLYLSKWIFRRRMILEDFFHKKLDKEYSAESVGFTNLFLKFSKEKCNDEEK
jgi:2-polyprenyl-3-methyl-5-hydroxy-6-metoxy-1,4-benzoquinol methylase